MGLKDFLVKVLVGGGSELRAHSGEVAKIGGEVGSVSRRASLSAKEALALEKGLNGFNATRKGAAFSTMRSGEMFFFEKLENGLTLQSGQVYKSTADDVIKIGGTKLSLSDPRIVKALESKGINGEIVVGRSSSCDVVLNDGFVSGEHIIIRQKCPGSKRLYIEDLHSTNGTSVIKTNKYSQADRAKDSARFEQYVDNAAQRRARSNPALSYGQGNVKVPYNSNCRMIRTAQAGEKMHPAGDYIVETGAKLRIGGEEISLSDPVIMQALKNKGSITVGRNTGCDIVVNNMTVSGLHLTINKLPDGKFMIHDLNSTNGTMLV